VCGETASVFLAVFLFVFFVFFVILLVLLLARRFLAVLPLLLIVFFVILLVLLLLVLLLLVLAWLGGLGLQGEFKTLNGQRARAKMAPRYRDGTDGRRTRSQRQETSGTRDLRNPRFLHTGDVRR
jgi:hypothetical protein